MKRIESTTTGSAIGGLDEAGEAYTTPKVHDLGSLEKVQGHYHGAHYDGPGSWLLYDY
jgi:hypothetical protein